jgi:hypothetical protein
MVRAIATAFMAIIAACAGIARPSGMGSDTMPLAIFPATRATVLSYFFCAISYILRDCHAAIARLPKKRLGASLLRSMRAYGSASGGRISLTSSAICARSTRGTIGVFEPVVSCDTRNTSTLLDIEHVVSPEGSAIPVK